MHLEGFIVSALLLLAVTSVAVALFRHLGLGSVLGLLIAGIVVGPHSPGPYVTPHVEDVRHFTELGVVLLLFVIGLEIKPSRLWSQRRDLLGLGSLQILLTGFAITFYVSLGPDSWRTALLIGLSLSLSSTAFVMQLLHEKGEFASQHGTGAFAVLLAQDLSVVLLLALVPLLSDTAAISAGIPLWEQLLILVGMFAVLFIFGLRLVPYALEWLARPRQSGSLSFGSISSRFVCGLGHASGRIIDGVGRFSHGHAAFRVGLQYANSCPHRTLQGSFDEPVLRRCGHVHRPRYAGPTAICIFPAHRCLDWHQTHGIVSVGDRLRILSQQCGAYDISSCPGG